jgi:hypothetical protein
MKQYKCPLCSNILPSLNLIKKEMIENHHVDGNLVEHLLNLDNKIKKLQEENNRIIKMARGG